MKIVTKKRFFKRCSRKKKRLIIGKGKVDSISRNLQRFVFEVARMCGWFANCSKRSRCDSKVSIEDLSFDVNFMLSLQLRGILHHLKSLICCIILMFCCVISSPDQSSYVSLFHNLMVLSFSRAAEAMMFSVGWQAVHKTVSVCPWRRWTISLL